MFCKQKIITCDVISHVLQEAIPKYSEKYNILHPSVRGLFPE